MEAVQAHGVGTSSHARPFDLSWIECDGRVVRCRECGASLDLSALRVDSLTVDVLRPTFRQFVHLHAHRRTRA